MNTGLEGLQQSTSVDHDERWVDAIVTESSGSGHIRFSIAGFFTQDVADELKPLLATGDEGHLRDLILELLGQFFHDNHGVRTPGRAD